MTTKIFYKNGFLYELVKAGKKALIYKQSLNDKIIAYEVHRIRLRKKRVLWGLLLNNFIRRPSDNDFGTRAWSFFTYERAILKFSKIEQRTFSITNLPQHKKSIETSNGPAPGRNY